MIFITLFLSWFLSKSNKIYHINVPSCKNCIYFKPSLMQIDEESLYTFGKCQKFGRKDIVSGKINYNFADVCRADDFKCGINGKYFRQEKYASIKIIAYKIVTLSYFVLALSFVIFYGYRIMYH